MKIDLERFAPFIKDKYISVQKHPTEELYIYNYTQKAQYDKVWTEETMMCRGLILDQYGNIVARPFKKFFNLSEHQGGLPEGKFRAWEKYDGSLGILYWIGNKPFIATRGSFHSEQAMEANLLLHSEEYKQHWWFLGPGETFLFEILYPQNRVVVDYGIKRSLIHLATINNETGEDMPLSSSPFEIAKQHELVSLTEIPPRENAEGYVFQWESGLRLKVKHEEYVRLHRLVTQTTARTIWEALLNQQSLEEILNRVPDEFYAWVKDMVKKIDSEFKTIHKYAKQKADEAREQVQTQNIFDSNQPLFQKDIDHLNGRLRTLLRERFSEKKEWESVCWLFYDKRKKEEIRKEIFKIIYPRHNKPFKKEL